MKPGELALIGMAGIMVGFMLAISPLINILFGWWSSPLLILGGILAIFAGILFALWEALRISTRFLICLFFREEEQGSPAIHHFVLNTKIWQLLGGGHCPSFLHRCAFLFFFLLLGISMPFESAWAGEALPAGRQGLAFDHSSYGKVLHAYLTDGKVDYASLKNQRNQLDAYVKSLSELSKKDYENMGPHEKIAFWINAYNAVAIQLVIDHRPLQKRLSWRALAFPENSIQQIPNVWNREVLEVFGEKQSLNHIEHKILRKEFREPRVHFALVCASLGCPILRGEPYDGTELNAQLEDQVRNFILDSKKVRYDEQTDALYLSPIFKWFRSDFERNGGVIAFVKTHWPNETKEKISEKTKIEWLHYDWSLNERRSP